MKPRRRHRPVRTTALAAAALALGAGAALAVPLASISSPAADATFFKQGDDVTAGYQCFDSDAPDVPLECVLSGDISPAGKLDTSTEALTTGLPKSFTVSYPGADPQTRTFYVDGTPPTIGGVIAPIANVYYRQGAVVQTGVNCVDNAGGSGVATCGPVALDTAAEGAHGVVFTATDTVSNPSSLPLIAYFVDGTPPSVDATAVVVERGTVASFLSLMAGRCSDPPGGASPFSSSGLQECVADAGNLPTATEGAGSFQGQATDNVGLQTQVTINYTVEDTTAPTVDIRKPAGTYERGAAVAADFDCSDFGAVLPVEACVALDEVETSTVGAKQFRVRSTDIYGNQHTAVSNYTVQDTKAPTVVFTGGGSVSFPKVNQTGVSPASKVVEVVFSEPVTGAGAGLKVCETACIGTTPGLAGTVVTGAGKATFTASAALKPNTRYQVLLTGVKDVPGNALTGPGATELWTYRTADDTDPPGPVAQAKATGGPLQVRLDWTNPSAGDFARVRVVRRTEAGVARFADATLVKFDVRGTSYVDGGLTAGTHYWYTLFAVDDAGNPSGGVVVDAVAGAGTTTGGSPTTPSGTPVPTPKPTATGPKTVNAKSMRPAAGARVRTLRPVLRWKRGPKATRLYNVQVFRGNRKVLSAFPKGTSFRIPSGRLKANVRYTWSVWPYVGKRYGKLLGTSNFITARKANLISTTPARRSG